MGYPVFYSDQVSKSLLASDPKIIHKIKSTLGALAYKKDGSVDKSYIANQIFSNADQLEAVNQIIHPAVRKEFQDFTSSKSSPIIFNESAILFETGGYDQFDKTILVTAPHSVRVKRVLSRDGITAKQVENRIKNQWTDEEKVPLADFIIRNGENDMLLPQIDRIISAILKLPTT